MHFSWTSSSTDKAQLPICYPFAETDALVSSLYNPVQLLSGINNLVGVHVEAQKGVKGF